jgi:tetratricopeptide (TPR) repeat protein
MRPHPLAALLAGASFLIGPAGFCRAQEPDEPPVIAKPDFAKPPPPKATDPPPTDGGPNAYVRTPDEIIAFFQERVKRVPKDFVSYRYLGEAYERKAREQDDLASYEKAEGAFRKALELQPNYSRAQAGLAAVLCSRHKFAEGLEIAKALYGREPKNVDALSTIGDAQLELGRYEEAEATFAALHKLAPIPEVVARQANLAETRGDLERAMTLMKKAAEEARKAGTAGDAAWYLVRMADVSLQVGKVAEAEALYQAVLKEVPEQHDATFGLGLVRQAQGRQDEALGLIERAVAIGPDPHMLAALGDLCLLANRPVEARSQFDRLEQATRGQTEYLRARSLFFSDHDRELPEALKLAEDDLAQRKDVHGYDALAWALYKNGKFAEAAKASAEAVKLGTPDAKLYYHAGLIQKQLGDRAKARELLSRALAINPHFGIGQAADAKKALDALAAEEPKAKR